MYSRDNLGLDKMLVKRFKQVFILLQMSFRLLFENVIYLKKKEYCFG